MTNSPISTSNTDLVHLRPTANDEIDLGELIRKLIKQWKLISSITVLGAILSIAYVLTATPIYNVSTIISRPTLADLGDATEQSLVPISAADAFNRITDELAQANNQERVFLASSLNTKLQELSDEQYNASQTFAELRNDLTFEKVVYKFNEVQKDEIAPLKDLKVSIETKYPSEAVQYLNELINEANNLAINRFEADVVKVRAERLKNLNLELESLTQSALQSREALIHRLEEANALKIAQIEQQLATKLANAKQDRLNNIIQLEEALATAQRLNIVEPVTWDDLRPNQRTSQITNELGETTKASPLYFQGSRILAAEIERLKSRRDDRPFIGDYNQLQQQIEDLKNDPQIAALKNRVNDEIYIEKFDTIKQDIADVTNEPTEFTNAKFKITSLEPIIPAEPIAPNKKLIVLAATIISGFLGVFIALIQIAITPKENG